VEKSRLAVAAPVHKWVRPRERVGRAEDTALDARKGEAMLAPDRAFPRLADVPLDDLAREGIRGLILDLDNTLAAFGEEVPLPEHRRWVERARARGFAMVLLSNNLQERVAAVAAALEIPAIHGALKPLPTGFVRAVRMLGLPRWQVAVIGDQLFTDVLGGKLCGLYTVLTEPIAPRDFPLTRILRALERLVLPHRRAS